MCQIHGNENGGILLGSEIKERHYRINRISEPCILINRSSKYECVRDADKANEIIKREFEVSGHKRIYLGEWHTHPESKPIPSFTDISSIREIFDKSKIVIEGVFIAIVGIETIYWGFYNGNYYSIKPIIV